MGGIYQGQLRNCYIQYYWYSILLIRLTPSHFTGADLGISSLSHNVALTPDTPPVDSMAFFNWSAVSTSWPELWYIQTWLLIVAALRSHYPLPPCGSEKSSFTLMWYLLATFWIASNVDALWEHPVWSCLKYKQFTSSGIAVLSCFKTSLMIARTVTLSWLQLSRMCTNVSIWGWTSEFLKAVVMCHEIPRLPNQSDWLLWYFRGRYLVAHSKTRSTEWVSSDFNKSNCALSRLIDQSKWAFHTSIFC